MQVLQRPWGAMHYRIDGPPDAPTVAFANSLGTDLRLWDALLALMPEIRSVRFDKRGHGLSDAAGPVTIADLADDAAALIKRVASGPVVFAGLSVGGLIGLRLSAHRPDLVRALVISNSAARLGTQESWAARIANVESGGIASIGDMIMERWFAPSFRTTPAMRLWRNMLTRTSSDGYIATCAAIAAADFRACATDLRLPVLAIAGSEDGAAPPDVVKATASLIPDARFHLMPGVGHLPCVEAPEALADILRPFLREHAR